VESGDVAAGNLNLRTYADERRSKRASLTAQTGSNGAGKDDTLTYADQRRTRCSASERASKARQSRTNGARGRSPASKEGDDPPDGEVLF